MTFIKNRLLPVALVALTTGAAALAVAATNDDLSGSDTLEVFTRTHVDASYPETATSLDNEVYDRPGTAAACPGTAGLKYVGGGSSTGEQAMLDRVTTDSVVSPTQELSPMSRFLDKNRVCRAPAPKNSQAYAVALDGLSVVEKKTNVQCDPAKGITVAADPAMTVTELNSVSGLQCPGCTGTSYKFANSFDVLKVLFAGVHNNGGKDCNSDVRHSLVANWDALHEGTCTTGTCTALSHAWRRDDLSGTTDAFLALLGLPSISSKPFCNGNSTEDLDPIRRACAADDQTCNADGKAGLVLPVFVPDLAPAFEGQAYATAACQTGKFGLAPSKNTDLGGGVIKRDCPEKESFSIAGFCLAPQTSAGSFRCNSVKNNPNVFFANLTDDARLFNRWVRTDAGDIALDKAGRPETFGWHKVRTNVCREQSSTLQIGCLVGEYDCSWGFAGLEASTGVPNAKSLNVNSISPTVSTVREILAASPVNPYPLARKLYMGSLKGFGNITDAKEAALSQCVRNEAWADFAAATSGFIPLAVQATPKAPVCEDFPETDCNGLTFSCDINADCGAAGICVGGDPGTAPKEGTCTMACTQASDCAPFGGRNVCNASGRCEFAAGGPSSCQ